MNMSTCTLDESLSSKISVKLNIYFPGNSYENREETPLAQADQLNFPTKLFVTCLISSRYQMWYVLTYNMSYTVK